MLSILPPPGDPFYDAVGLEVVTMLKQRFDMGGQPGAVWPPPKWRPGGKPLMGPSGILQRSINHLVRPTPTGAQISVGTADQRAAVLHFGGTIYPTNAKALFLPLSAKGRRVGPKPPGERVSKKLTKGGAEVFDALKYGVDFILVGSVTIPARPFIFLAPEQKEDLKRFIVYELRARGFGGN